MSPGGLRLGGSSAAANGGRAHSAHGPRRSRRQASAPCQAPRLLHGATASHSVVVRGRGCAREARSTCARVAWQSQSSKDGSRPRGTWAFPRGLENACSPTARHSSLPGERRKSTQKNSGFSEPFSLRTTTTGRRPCVDGRPGSLQGQRAREATEHRAPVRELRGRGQSRQRRQRRNGLGVMKNLGPSLVSGRGATSGPRRR